MLKDENCKTIEVTDLRPLSPHTQALYEAGKSVLIDSIQTGREFCKFMIGAATGGIPIYLGLLSLFLPQKYHPSFSEGVTLLIPALLFLATAVVSVIGYFPKCTRVSLEILEEIRNDRDRIIAWRRRFGILAFVMFLVAIVAAIVFVLLAASSFGQVTGGNSGGAGT